MEGLRIGIAASLLLALSTLAQQKEEERLNKSYNVLKEILATPDKGYLATRGNPRLSRRREKTYETQTDHF